MYTVFLFFSHILLCFQAAPLSTLEVKLDKLPINCKKIKHDWWNLHSLVSYRTLHGCMVYLCIVCVIVLAQKDMLLKLQGAYNEKQVISVSENSSFMKTISYIINKNLETSIELQTVRWLLCYAITLNVYKDL